MNRRNEVMFEINIDEFEFFRFSKFEKIYFLKSKSDKFLWKLVINESCLLVKYRTKKFLLRIIKKK